MIVVSKKKKIDNSIRETGSSSVGLLTINVEMYFDDWFGKMLDDNKVCEDQIMSRIEVVSKEVEEGRERIREKVKAGEARFMSKVLSLKRYHGSYKKF